ncbi:GxxExxY protein [Phenylobacterium sp.]|uniref:GxxExxY protein n=1 Tax=Phenylobacterium sp. TaxID=1871053 RepID=UPI00286D53B0|nr:GxxExxY protein [Phenylobacterium sp.]
MDGAPIDGLPYQDEAFQIRGAAFEVYRAMGAGFSEAVHQECLEGEFARRGVLFETHRPLGLTYRGKPLRQTYVADFVHCDPITVELKAARRSAKQMGRCGHRPIGRDLAGFHPRLSGHA